MQGICGKFQVLITTKQHLNWKVNMKVLPAPSVINMFEQERAHIYYTK